MATILIIEDNPTNMALAKFLLESAGHTVRSATDAEAGLTLARDPGLDLILMDIQLPGIDGFEAVSLLKHDAATRSIPVIAITALAMKGDEERIRAAGFDGYIGKPMRYQEFLATVATHLLRSEAPFAALNRAARILIVDDERDNRELLSVILTYDGFLTVTAVGGEEALAIVAMDSPDLILLDLMMPGMDGYEVATTLKSNVTTRDIPIIIVTALSDRETRVRALGAGANDVVTKPVDRDDLYARMRSLLPLGTAAA